MNQPNKLYSPAEPVQSIGQMTFADANTQTSKTVLAIGRADHLRP